jgi:hypothetical protein
MSRWGVILVTAALSAAVSVPAAAQERQDAPPLGVQPAALLPVTMDPGHAAQDTARTPVLEYTHPRFFWAAGEVVFLNTAIWSFNRIQNAFDVTEQGDTIYWASISPSTMLHNLQRGWVWDDNAFINNQFAHPYHGNLYYNSARANGYNYWQSLPFTIAGSWMWEYLMETHPPAPNDWVSTSLGGAALGEMTYRFSSLILDNRSHGTGRAFRELGAALLNPMRGLNRVVQGKVGAVGPNPDEWSTPFLRSVSDVGYRRIKENIGSDTTQTRENFVFFQTRFDYGDPFDYELKRPFDYFEMTVQLATNEKKPLNKLQVRGMLAVHDLRRTDRSDLLLGAFQHYDYINSKYFEVGGQSFVGRLMWRKRVGETGEFRTQLGLGAVVLGAISSEYADVVGRSYDYGPGGFGSVGVSYLRNNRVWVSLSATTLYIHTVNGAEGEHFASQLAGRVDIPVVGPLGIGVEGGLLRRDSYYSSYPDVVKNNPQAKVFVSWTAK